MPLASNRELDRYVDQEIRTLPVKASAHLYKGAFVGLEAATGLARPLVGGDPFAGVAYEEADNTGGADGAICVRVFTLGDFDHPLSGVTRASNGALLYASADNALSLTSSGNSLVGRQVDVPGTNRVVLRIKSVFSS
jgi:hypothetical protein